MVENKINNFIGIFLIIGLFFCSSFSSLFPIESLDEILCLFALFVIGINIILKQVNAKSIFVLVVLIISIIVGILGNLSSNYYLDIKSYFLDIFLYIKPFIILSLFLSIKLSDKELKFTLIFSKISILIISLASIVYFINNGFVIPRDSNNGFKFFGEFPGDIALIIIEFLAILLVCKSKKMIIYIFLGFIPVLMSASGLGMVSFFLMILINVIFSKFKFRIIYLPLILLVCILVGWNEVTMYITNTDSARFIMYKYAIVTANGNFPFGSGFGTYGGYMALHNYSTLYIKYGFNNIYGLSEASYLNGHGCFLFDTYYPMIIGQFGYLFFLAVVIILTVVIKRCIKGNMKLTLTLIIIILIMAVGFNIGGKAGCLFMAIIGIVLSKEEKA